MAVAAEATPAPQRRLHPWSWLFVLLAQLRSFALPLIAIVLFGGGGRNTHWELVGGAFAGLLALGSVVQYFTYRYGVVGADLVVRAGLFSRNVRSIPLKRIRNVTLHRTPLHRLFGVAEVRLESAAGATAEAHMRVLSLADAAELEALVRGRVDAGDGTAPATGEVLLALPTSELVRLGLISNRGMVVVGAAMAALWQIVPDGLDDLVGEWGRRLFGEASTLGLGWLQWTLALLALVLLAVVLLRLLSIALALVQFHGFRLVVDGDTLGVESGLLTRVRGHAPLRKIQFWTVTETLLHRLFARQSLQVETAVLQADESARALTQLAPVATPATIERLIARLLPQARFPHFDWQPLHPRAWRRMAVVPVLLTVLASGALTARVGAAGLLLLALLPWWLLRARFLARAAGWALDGTVIAYRSGWLDRRASFAEVAKLQGVQLLHTPFDRRHGMATLSVDTAGAGVLGHRIHIRYLPEEVARSLATELGGRIARSPLAW